jgi:hypothetical protein
MATKAGRPSGKLKKNRGFNNFKLRQVVKVNVLATTIPPNLPDFHLQIVLMYHSAPIQDFLHR